MSSRTFTLKNGLGQSIQVGAIGYGLMNLTWRPTQTPDDVAFAAIKAACIPGVVTFLNSGEFYGTPKPEMNLDLLNRFYTANPEYAEKTFLSVKGGIGGFKPNSSEEFLRKSVNNINNHLGPNKKMDLFECARVDKTRPIEDVIKVLKKLIEEGHFQYIGLSEVSAETIRRAHAVHPIAAVEVEYSLITLDIEKNDVLKTCQELGIPVVAYSPIGKGLLSDAITKPEDVPEGDFRRRFDRFQPEAFEENAKIIAILKGIAQAKGISVVQLSLAWLLAQEGVMPIPGSTRVAGVKEAVESLNVKFTEAELKTIRNVIDNAKIVGHRYNKSMIPTLEG